MTVQRIFQREDVRKKFEEIMGKKASAFITSVLQIVASSDLLQKADPMSIYQCAAVAATLDLPLNNNLGFAWIVPYNVRQKDGSYKVVAQFQIGYKGFKQLALRSGQFQTINQTDVRQGEISERDFLTGEMQFNWIQNEAERLKQPIVGFVSYFKLLNGYEQTFYMSVEQLKAHGAKYSKTYGKAGSKWNDEFEAMASKTVTKLNLSKNAPLSIEMQKAVIYDQAVINDAETQDVTYVDNSHEMTDPRQVAEAKERTRIIDHINNSTTPEMLMEVKDLIGEDEELVGMYEFKLASFA